MDDPWTIPKDHVCGHYHIYSVSRGTDNLEKTKTNIQSAQSGTLNQTPPKASPSSSLKAIGWQPKGYRIGDPNPG